HAHPMETLQRAGLKDSEASLVKALVVSNPGISQTDAHLLISESEAYGKMLFELLQTNRGDKNRHMLSTAAAGTNGYPLLDEIMRA
ncbi:hypothetical protein PMAYCL1PPCAC_16363, partial [Pristionchus mayeri]